MLRYQPPPTVTHDGKTGVDIRTLAKLRGKVQMATSGAFGTLVGYVVGLRQDADDTNFTVEFLKSTGAGFGPGPTLVPLSQVTSFTSAS